MLRALENRRQLEKNSHSVVFSTEIEELQIAHLTYFVSPAEHPLKKRLVFSKVWKAAVGLGALVGERVTEDRSL